MLRTRFIFTVALSALTLSLTQPVVRAEHPLERLHRHIFGADDDDKKKDRKKKDKDKHRDDRDHRHHDDYRSRSVQVVPHYRPDFRSHYEAEHDYGRRYHEPETRHFAHDLSLEAEVQVALRRSGYYHGRIDGELGGETRAAIRHFQYDHRLAVTGRIDRDLLRTLRL